MEKVEITIGDIIDIKNIRFTVTSIETNSYSASGDYQYHVINGVNGNESYAAYLYINRGKFDSINLISYASDGPYLLNVLNPKETIVYVNNNIINNKLIEVY